MSKILNFDDTDPAPDSGYVNIKWKENPVSAGTDPTTGYPYFNISGEVSVSNLATKAGVQQESYIYAADTGTANAYAVTLSPAPTIVAGSVAVVKIANANTGASTLAVNGGTATPIKKQGSTALASGDLSAGQIAVFVNDGTNWQWLGSSGGGAVTSLTTSGSSGAATLSGGVLNIPIYSGGGGGGGGLFSPNIGTVPTLSGTGLSTLFGGGGSYSAADASNGITLQDVSTGGTGTSKYSGQVRAYPGTPYTLTALISVPISITNFSTMGLVIMDTVTGKHITFRACYNNGWGYDAYSWSAPNVLVANVFVQTGGPIPSQVWLRLKDNGTTVVFSASSDGCYFWTVGTLTKSSSYLGASGFNYLGFFINPQGYNVGSTLMSWVITNP